MNWQSGQWPRCYGSIPPCRDRKSEEVETAKETNRPKSHTEKEWACIKGEAPGGRGTDKLETATKRERQKIHRVIAEIVCGPLESGAVHKGEQSLFISLSCGDEEESLKIMLVARVQEPHSLSAQTAR